VLLTDIHRRARASAPDPAKPSPARTTRYCLFLLPLTFHPIPPGPALSLHPPRCLRCLIILRPSPIAQFTPPQPKPPPAKTPPPEQVHLASAQIRPIRTHPLPPPPWRDARPGVYRGAIG
jgi:hypothetical protein